MPPIEAERFFYGRCMYLSSLFVSEIDPSIFPRESNILPMQGLSDLFSVVNEPILSRFCAIGMDSFVFSPRTEFRFLTEPSGIPFGGESRYLL